MNRVLERAWLRQFPLWALLLTLLAATPAWAAPGFLEPQEAFALDVREQGQGQVQLHWKIAPGYYLYRDRLGASGDGAVTVSKPPGKAKEDPNFGTMEVYHDAVLVDVAAGNARALKVTWQGCAEEGLCYPPEERTVTLAGCAPTSPAATRRSATSCAGTR